jgi:hypothetical protein
MRLQCATKDEKELWGHPIFRGFGMESSFCAFSGLFLIMAHTSFCSHRMVSGKRAAGFMVSLMGSCPFRPIYKPSTFSCFLALHPYTTIGMASAITRMTTWVPGNAEWYAHRLL